MSEPPDLTISDVASELRIRREHVIALLKSGALEGYDATPPGARQKSYRITRQALDQFKRERSAVQVTARKKRTRRKSADFVEYF